MSKCITPIRAYNTRTHTAKKVEYICGVEQANGSPVHRVIRDRACVRYIILIMKSMRAQVLPGHACSVMMSGHVVRAYVRAGRCWRAEGVRLERLMVWSRLHASVRTSFAEQNRYVILLRWTQIPGQSIGIYFQIYI